VAVVAIADGGGPTVLFLHGWGLTHRSYTAPIRTLAAAGFRVLAPDLPGFGGTAELPVEGLSFRGFAAFLDQLLERIEGDQPVHVVGHSFGGGVSTQLAYDFPDRVRSVVLIDAVSGATWIRSGTGARPLASRPLWDWAWHLMLELPVTGAPRAVPGLLGEVTVNLVRHPANIGLVANLIRRSDLRAELAEVYGRGTPVRVVWASGDRVVPRAAFEDLCEAACCQGEVVEGSHSWLLAQPERFASLVASTIATIEPAQPAEAAMAAAVEMVVQEAETDAASAAATTTSSDGSTVRRSQRVRPSSTRATTGGS
jgi:pimeloyl-ACP methyl ester carboxylesterase